MSKIIKVRQADTLEQVGDVAESEAVFCFEDKQIYASADGITKESFGGGDAQLHSVMLKNKYPVTKGEKITNTFKAKGFVMVVEPHNVILRNQRTGQIGSQITLDKGDAWEYTADFDGELIVIETEQRFGYRVEDKEWGFFTLSADQTANLSVGNNILFDVSAGNIILSNGTIKLKQGKIYKLESSLYAYNQQSGGYLNYGFYDKTHSIELGTTGQSLSVNYPSGGSGLPTAMCIITPNEDIEIELKIVSNTSTSKVFSKFSFAYVEEIGVTGQLADEYYYVPPGTVFHFADSNPPAGWLKCDGSALDREVYKRLYGVIGTTFGEGDGSTTFNIPDLRGEFVRGWDDSRGVDTGRVFGSGQMDELRTHTHDTKKTAGVIQNTTWVTQVTNTDRWNIGEGLIECTGGTETRPRNLALLPCIKY